MALLKLRNYIDLATLKAVYYSLIYSHVQYCLYSCKLASINTLTPLKLLHKQTIKTMMFAHKQTLSLFLFYSLNVLKIVNLCKFEIAYFNYLHNLKPIR